MKYFLIAGEASGDLHASHLMEAILQQDPKAEFRYFGGEKMQAVGGTLLRHYRTLAYMGFWPVIRHLPEILRGRRQCRQSIADFNPETVILIDYPGFNLDFIAPWVKRKMPRTKVVYYISPKIWAWKSYRLKKIRKYVDLMLSILPFEVAWYHERGYEVNYVGNPTVDELSAVKAQSFDRDAFCRKYELNENQDIIAILPGSRKTEIANNLPVMIEGCCGFPGHQLVVAGAPSMTISDYQAILDNHRVVPPVKVVFNDQYSLLRASSVAAVTSGTATLETAYLEVPQVVCYALKGGKLFYRIMRWALRHIRYVSLVNLLLDHEAVKELLGPYFTIGNLRREIFRLLENSREARLMKQQYAEMIRVLGPAGAPQRAAQAILKLMNS